MVKTSRRKPKRQADGDPAASSSSAVQPALKRKQQRLIIEAFPVSARESQELQDLDLQDLGAASSTSAAQTPQLQQFEQRMRQLLAELGKVSLGRVVGSAAIELQTMLAEFRLLLSQKCPVPQKKNLRQPSMKALYTFRCGALSTLFMDVGAKTTST